MTDPSDRDRAATPIGGVRVRSISTGDFAAEDTGTSERTLPEDATAIDEASAHRMQRRVKETNIAAAEANSGIQTLRMETRAHVERIDGRVTGVEVKVDALSDHVIGLVGATGRMEGQLGELVKVVDDQRGRQHVTFSAQVDVDREATVAEIKDGADVKIKRRELRYKIAMALVGGVSAIALTLEHCS